MLFDVNREIGLLFVNASIGCESIQNNLDGKLFSRASIERTNFDATFDKNDLKQNKQDEGKHTTKLQKTRHRVDLGFKNSIQVLKNVFNKTDFFFFNKL